MTTTENLLPDEIWVGYNWPDDLQDGGHLCASVVQGVVCKTKYTRSTPPDSVSIKREVVEKVRREVLAGLSDVQQFTNAWFDLDCGEDIADGLRRISEALSLLDDALKGKV